jgi:hypothetical protein
MDEKLIEDFRRFCLTENDNKYEPGIYSAQITKAVNMLLESKKPKDEIIDLEELETTGDEFQ